MRRVAGGFGAELGVATGTAVTTVVGTGAGCVAGGATGGGVGAAVAVRNVLTPEQVKKLAEVHRKLHSLHNQIRGLMGSGDDMGGADN